MKKTTHISLLILFCITLVSPNLFAQKKERDGQKHKERFEAFKKQREAYITQEMGMTTEEASLFWNLCNEWDAKKFELNKELRKKKRELRAAKKKGEEISDTQYKEYLEMRANVRLKEAELEKEYLGKFLKIVPAKKMSAFYRADMEFGRKMMNQRKGNGDKS